MTKADKVVTAISKKIENFEHTPDFAILEKQNILCSFCGPPDWMVQPWVEMLKPIIGTELTWDIQKGYFYIYADNPHWERARCVLMVYLGYLQLAYCKINPKGYWFSSIESKG
jgi:hypothetical protein